MGFKGDFKMYEINIKFKDIVMCLTDNVSNI